MCDNSIISLGKGEVDKRDSLTKKKVFQRYSAKNNLVPNELKLSSLGLRGRESEIKQLRKACHRVHRRPKNDINSNFLARQNSSSTKVGNEETFLSPEVVLISGCSGTGKSFLVQSMIHDVTHAKDMDGFFATGKFSMRERSEPYTAFLSAFDNLCDKILAARDTRSKNSLDYYCALRIESALRDALGSENNILADIIPKLNAVLRKEDVSTERNAHGVIDKDFVLSRNRFNFLLRKFVQSYCSEKTLLLFLDDLQWADTASLELIKTLASDKNNPNLLIIGSYRDDDLREMNPPLAMCLHELKTANTTTTTSIHLKNLDVNAANEIISYALTSNTETTLSLAKIVHKKTQGNPFAIIHFLKNMLDEGFLQFCLGSLRWKWDEEKVQINMSASDNVVEMMVTKIKKNLQADVRKILQVAACVGGTFDSTTISYVAEKIQSLEFHGDIDQHNVVGKKKIDCKQCLKSCVNEGLLDTVGSQSYRFVHDQISAAAFSLIPEERRDFIQFRIGEVLLEKLPPSELQKNIFAVVGLLNCGAQLIANNEEKSILLSRLNLQAATKAMNVSAFGPGAIYIETGIRLLKAGHWTNQKSLSLALHNTGAKIEYCNGNLDKINGYIDQLKRQTWKIKEQITAYSIQIEALVYLEYKADEAWTVSLNVLSQLGFHLPRKSSKLRVVKSFLKTKKLMNKISTDDLSSLPLMVDENKIFAMEMFGQMLQIAYFSKPYMLPLTCLKMLRLTVCHGITTYSSLVFAAYALILSSMDDMNGATRFADLAINLVQKSENKVLQPIVFFICYWFVLFRRKPLFLVQKLHLEYYEVGMQVGDVNFAFAHIAASIITAFVAGKPLRTINLQVDEYLQETREFKQTQYLCIVLELKKFVLNMMRCSSDPSSQTRDVVQLEHYAKQVEKGSNENVLLAHAKTYEFWNACYFGNFEHARDVHKELTCVTKNRKSQTPLFSRSILFEGLTAASLARKTKSSRWKKRAIKITSKVKQWVDDGDVNFKHILSIFEAELAVLDKDHNRAQQKYSEAISTCSRFGYIHDKALANERIGEYLLETEDACLASHYIVLARQLYLRWGAVSKANHIYERHKTMFNNIDSDCIALQVDEDCME